MTDAELFHKLVEGDEGVLEQIYVKHRSKSVFFASKKLYRNSSDGKKQACSLDEAVELYHEAIIVIVENIRAGRLSDLRVKFSTYIIATMKNKWLGQIRKQNIRLDDLSELPVEDSPQDDVIKDKVRKALAKMDEKCREMLSLRYFMDWDYEDIAISMNYNKGDVVRNLISRCRSRFRSIVTQLEKSESKNL